MKPLDKRNSITTFRRSFDNFEENLKYLLSEKQLSVNSPEKSLIPIFKTLGLLEGNGHLSPVGKLLREQFQKYNQINYSFLRIQIVFYLQERDSKPLSLDIMNFVFNNPGTDIQGIVDFLKEKDYYLGSNELQSVVYFIPYLEKVGYIKERNKKYYIPEQVHNFASKFFQSFIYKNAFFFKEY